jgi:predicted nuclease with TOPRIM domain
LNGTFKPTLDRSSVDRFIDNIRKIGGDDKSLQRALEWFNDHFEEFRLGEDPEKEELKKKIERLEAELDRERERLESLRNADPKVLVKEKEWDVKRDIERDKIEIKKLELELKKELASSKNAVEIFKLLLKTGKINPEITDAINHKIRKELKLDALEEG